jgi:hypothetical protein
VSVQRSTVFRLPSKTGPYYTQVTWHYMPLALPQTLSPFPLTDGSAERKQCRSGNLGPLHPNTTMVPVVLVMGRTSVPSHYRLLRATTLYGACESWDFTNTDPSWTILLVPGWEHLPTGACWSIQFFILHAIPEKSISRYWAVILESKITMDPCLHLYGPNYLTYDW